MKTQVFIPHEPALPAMQLKAAIIDRFNGYTSVEANGAWKMPSGQICIEPVEIVEIIYPMHERTANESWFFEQCHEYGIQARQDAVLITHDNEPVFIETKAAA